MNFIRLTVCAALLTLMIGCGDAPADPEGGGLGDHNSGAGAAARSQPDDIRLIWNVASKKCDGATVVIKPLEVYRLDKDHIVRVERSSEDQHSLCKIGYVYDRIVSSSNSGRSTYTESGILQSSASKKTCWAKKNGSPVEPPTSNIIGKFGPEQAEYSLSATETSVSLRLKASPSCAGELSLELVRAQ